MRDQYSRLSDIIRKYEQIWLQLYLPSLRERHLVCARETISTINIGDVVLLELENRKRHSYPVGIVVQVYKGNDGVIRSVLVRTAENDYHRPLNKLIPLELKDETVPVVHTIEPEPDPSVFQRPKRLAAQKAQHNREELLREGLL